MRAIRLALIAAALGLLAWFAWTARDALSAVAWHEPRTLAALAMMLAAWIVGQVLAGIGWWILLGRTIGVRRAVAILLTTQIGKYLPGNVGQFVGRAYLARRHGVSVANSGATLTAEALLGIGTGLVLAVAMVALDPAGTAALADFLPGFSALATLAASLAAALAALVLFPARIARLVPADSRLRAVVPPPLPALALLQAAALAMLLYLVLAAALWALAPVFAGAPIPPSVAVAVLTAAYVTGFLVPGAPGGLGVREAVFVAGLAPYLGADDAMVIALVMRAATILGDGAIFIMGWLLLPPERDPIVAAPP